MDNGKERYIFTCNFKNRKLALYELEKYDDSFHFVKWMDEEIGLFETELENEELCRCVREKPIIFVRHLFKVNGIGTQRECADEIVAECKKALEAGSSFTVQTRRVNSERNSTDENNTGSADPQAEPMTTELANRLMAEGYWLDVAAGEHIISLLVEEETVYWGLGNAHLNLSHWKGGMPHYSPTAEFGFVSRAEYKLLEALECFGIELKEEEKAADLGAAPGGWTKVLIEKGLECTSIDPSYLKPEIARNGKVRYYHMTVEEYLRSEKDEKFHIVVNDMKMDMVRSVGIINEFYDRIHDGGIVIMTFKLPHEYSYSNILKTIQMLGGFVLIGARQLFHNRYEITVALRKEKEQWKQTEPGRQTERGRQVSYTDCEVPQTQQCGGKSEKKFGYKNVGNVPHAQQSKDKRTMSKKLERKMQRKAGKRAGQQ